MITAVALVVPSARLRSIRDFERERLETHLESLRKALVGFEVTEVEDDVRLR